MIPDLPLLPKAPVVMLRDYFGGLDRRFSSPLIGRVLWMPDFDAILGCGPRVAPQILLLAVTSRESVPSARRLRICRNCRTVDLPSLSDRCRPLYSRASEVFNAYNPPPSFRYGDPNGSNRDSWCNRLHGSRTPEDSVATSPRGSCCCDDATGEQAPVE